MTAQEVYELTTQGGATDFANVVQFCAQTGPYCLIGDLAVNCYVEPVYTMDADLVIAGERLAWLADHFVAQGFRVQEHPHSLNIEPPASSLRIQFTKDARYQSFPERAAVREVLGCQVCVASLDDVFQGKLWAWLDPQRRLTKRKKDELDLLRLAEAHPHLRASLPPALRDLLD